MRRFTLFLLAGILFLISACGQGREASRIKSPVSSPQAGRPLKIAVQSFYCSSMAGLIKSMGWDAEAGIPFEITAYPDGVQLNQALGESDWDVAITGAAFIYAMVNNDAFLIAHQVDGTRGNIIVCRNDSPILKVRGFNPTCPDVYGDPSTVKGLEVLCNVGTAAHYTLSNWLESIGVKESDITIRNLDFEQSYLKFIDGTGDLSSLTPPNSFKNLNRLGWTKIASLEDVGAQLLESTLCSRKAYEERREDIVKFVRLLYRANDMLNADSKLRFETVKNWYNQYGKNLSTDEINEEIASKPFIGSEQAGAMDMNDFVMRYAEYFVNTGIFSPEQLSVIKEHIAGDIISEALRADE